MRIFSLGGAARDRALVSVLSEELGRDSVHFTPEHRFLSRVASTHAWNFKGTDDFLGRLKESGIDVLIAHKAREFRMGLADLARDQGIAVFGPDRQSAQLESSKAFGKAVMRAAGIPTPKYSAMNAIDAMNEMRAGFPRPSVIKADFPSNESSTMICEGDEDLMKALKRFAPDDRVIVEEFVSGWEITLHVLTDGRSFEYLPYVKDHKRLEFGDTGPNTEGMGALAPYPVPAALDAEIKTRIVEPTIHEIKRRGFFFRGVLNFGIIISDGKPLLLEYNVRFGDPELQALLPLLDGSWSELIARTARGILPRLRWKSEVASCVVMMTQDSSAEATLLPTPLPIDGDPSQASASARFFFQGADIDTDGRWLLSSTRGLTALGTGLSTQEAVRAAYRKLSEVSWRGLHYRADIGATRV